MEALGIDVRCIDAHAHLGNLEFDRSPERAIVARHSPEEHAHLPRESVVLPNAELDTIAKDHLRLDACDPDVRRVGV